MRALRKTAVLGLAALLLLGCEGEEEEHVPPPGQGSLVLDNRTPDRINVFLNGQPTNRVVAYDTEIYDLAPGTYRLVLDEEDGNGYGAWDVDVVLGRLTIAEVDAPVAHPDQYTLSLHMK